MASTTMQSCLSNFLKLLKRVSKHMDSHDSVNIENFHLSFDTEFPIKDFWINLAACQVPLTVHMCLVLLLCCKNCQTPLTLCTCVSFRLQLRSGIRCMHTKLMASDSYKTQGWVHDDNITFMAVESSTFKHFACLFLLGCTPIFKHASASRKPSYIGEL